MKIKTLLLRLGNEKLIQLINDDIFKVLMLRNKSLNNQKNLTEIILKLNTEKKLLSEQKSRNLIIDTLKENEALIIGKLFNLSNKNIWQSLKNLIYLRKFFKNI